MSLTDEVATIRQHFDTQVASALDLQVRHDNDPRDTPKDETWMQVTILDGESRQIEVGASGSNTHRTDGVMIVNTFTTLGVGDKIARLATEKIKAIFRNKVVGNVSFKAVTTRRIGKTGAVYQFQSSVPFRYEELA